MTSGSIVGADQERRMSPYRFIGQTTETMHTRLEREAVAAKGGHVCFEHESTTKRVTPRMQESSQQSARDD